MSVNRENTPGDTYENINTAVSDVIQAHSQVLGKFYLSLQEEMKKLACMYWRPKLHKDPVGERYIIASPECSVNPLLKDATCILKLFQNNIKNMIKIVSGLMLVIFGLFKIINK